MSDHDIDLNVAVEAGAQAMADDWNPERDPILTAMFRDYASSAIRAALPHILAQVDARVKPSREDVAKIVAEAALDWVDVESEMHWHTLDCTNWTAYADEADRILALFPGRTEQEVREEIAGISEEAAMDLWWEACDDEWAVPDDLPSRYLKHVVREMLRYAARGGAR